MERQIERLIAGVLLGSTTIEADSQVLMASDFGISETPSLGDETPKSRVLQAVNIGWDDLGKAFFHKIARM